MANISRYNPVYSVAEEDFLANLRLHVTKVLSSGIFGDVVLVHSKIQPRYQEAMKVLTLSDNADMKKRLFCKEMLAMKVFCHYNLMKARHAVRTPLRLYISMQFCPMGSLDKNLRGLNFLISEYFLVQLASAVKHMHDHRFVHNEINLSNILLASHTRVLLADFGYSFQMSKFVDVIYARYIGGTMKYLPPEMLNGDIDAVINPMKVDMYALGVVLKAMIYHLDPEEALNGHPSPVRTADVPPLLLYCMENLLKEDPAERFSSKQLMDVLLQRSLWKQQAKELEETFVAVQDSDFIVIQDLHKTDGYRDMLYCMENLLKEDPAERFSSKQLMDVLLQRSQWKQKAKELEETFVAVPGASAKVRQNVYAIDALYNFLQIPKQNRSEF